MEKEEKVENQKAIVFGIVNKKGGVGKSSLIQLVAGYIQYVLFKNILVIDADPQGSITNQRELDSIEFSDDERIGAYTIVSIEPEEVIEYIEMSIRDYDYIVVDLFGTTTTKGNVPAYARLDKLILPTSTSIKDLPVTVDFHDFLRSEIFPVRKRLGYKVADIVVILNRIQLNLKEYKDLRLCIEKAGNDIVNDIEKNLKDGFGAGKIYPYPFYFLDGVISEAKGQFGQYINTLLTDRNMRIFSKYKSQCKEIFQFLNF